MNVWHVLAIILFTMQVILALTDHGQIRKVSFPGNVVNVIIWNIILYYGGFW